MKTMHNLIPISALLLAAAALPAERPRLSAEAGTEVKRSYHSSTDLKSESMRMTVDGEDLPGDSHPEISLLIKDRRTVVFTDTYKRVEDGRVIGLVRAYDEIQAEGKETSKVTPPGGEEREQEKSLSRVSKLSGKTVKFTWNAAEEEHDVAFDGEKGDSDLLEGLRADADMTGFLPKNDVEEGAEWNLPARLFAFLDEPGGELHLVVEGEEKEPSVSESMNDQIDANMTGDATATWRGVREVDGQRLGVIAVRAKLSSHAEQESDEGSAARSVRLDVEYEGEILWNMAAGHLAGYDLGGPAEAVYATVREIETPKGKVEFRQEFHLSGETRHRLD